MVGDGDVNREEDEGRRRRWLGEVGEMGSSGGMRKESLRGRRLDLKMEQFSEEIPLVRIRPSMGKGRMGMLERPCLGSERYVLSFSIFFSLRSFEARYSFARPERVATSSA